MADDQISRTGTRPHRLLFAIAMFIAEPAAATDDVD
jgi:hypothetical protein